MNRADGCLSRNLFLAISSTSARCVLSLFMEIGDEYSACFELFSLNQDNAALAWSSPSSSQTAPRSRQAAGNGQDRLEISPDNTKHQSISLSGNRKTASSILPRASIGGQQSETKHVARMPGEEYFRTSTAFLYTMSFAIECDDPGASLTMFILVN